jgi:glycosyltransferase involved in cell wall biosynthesis
MKVLHIIPGLETGGTEVFLANLLPALQARGIECTLFSLRKGGTVAARLIDAGVTVQSLGVGGYASSALAWPRLRALARDTRPDVIHGWLYHGNLAASLVRSTIPTAYLLWSIRHSLVGRHHEKAATRLMIRFGARVSRRVDRVIYNAQESARQHARAGFANERAVVIPNGIDTNRFTPDPASRSRNRRAHGFGDEDLLVGIVARYHPIKGHSLFVTAAAIAAGKDPRLRFLMLGSGLNNSKLERLLACSGIRDKIRLIDERTDVSGVLNMLDVHVSASWGEGFPNVVGEAMACGVPCVVTDVGASRELVGDTGAIVAPGSSQSLAAAILELTQRPAAFRLELGAAARDRVARLFSWDRSVSAYAELYANLQQRLT